MLKSRASLHRSGFTLVELIVAMAILVIIVAAMGQIMGTASSLTTANNKHTDANGRARTVFDRMATDFARMVKRNDVDFIFWKTLNGNDAMYFYTEGAGYYDGTNPGQPGYKNSVSLVGYRVNTLATALSYGQMERLGKALLWDGAAGTNPSMIFLNYPVPENQPTGSAAYAYSTLADGTLSGPAVGTPGNFSDSTDTSYHPFASNVFRFEYSFQLKDGTQSDIPIMKVTATNGVPFSNLAAGGPPTDANDSSQSYAAGSRWYDTLNQIGYICVDASAGNAVWHEIGIQDISAIVVTIAVIDDQGSTFLKASGRSLNDIASLLKDYNPAAPGVGSMTTGDPAYLLDPANASSWAYALLPGNAVSAVLPQSMASQIRIYQRFFYINNT